MINEDSQQPEEQPDDVLDEEPLTISRGKEIIIEQSERLKQAGWKPFRDMVGSYVVRVVDAVQGLADGFDGKKRDK